jgi:alpha-1,6-mannosyltransferase
MTSVPLTSGLAAAPRRLHLATAELPANPRPDAELTVLDATEWFGETSGGIRTYLLEKGRYVAARRQLRQVVLVPGNEDAIDDASGVRFVRMRGPSIPRHRPYRFLLASRSIARVIRHEQPDLIEIGSPFLVPWLVHQAVRHANVPLAYFHHTDVARVVSNVTPASLRPHVTPLVWRYLRQIARRCAVAIVATESGKRELEANGFGRVERVPLGVDLDTFTPARRLTGWALRAHLGLPDAPLAVFAGRFAREKELDVVLDAWSRVEAQTGARLMLVGAGPDAARLRAHPYARRVLFQPFVSDRTQLAALLAAADLYVAPGPAETFGLAAVEAMACGTPVLSVNRGGVAEHVAKSGAGLCYEPGDATSLVHAAACLLGSDLTVLGARAHGYAVAEHSWAHVFDRLFALYASLRR